ncbi:CBU_0592 family membrane protein [Brevundimonas sp. TWP2-3-2]|uniref:CBU_0592 family membrane protein n=1 Tax=unclassified Brevundimonas TaxID=2622653 RepID=UPI003CEB718E
MTLPDFVGVVGVLCILTAYAGATAKKLDPTQAPALLLNLTGALLILVSLYFDFNLSAVLMEGAWALVALIGLARRGLSRKI